MVILFNEVFNPPSSSYHNQNHHQDDDNHSKIMVMKMVLKIFNCPFRSKPGGCYHEFDHQNCSFSHSPFKLTTCDIPDTVCVHYLMGYCRNLVRTSPDSDVDADSGTIPTGCYFGLHLCASDILVRSSSSSNSFVEATIRFELEVLEKWYILLMAEFVGQDIWHQCSICFEHILAKRPFSLRRFGVLEKCGHLFCEDCLGSWRQTNYDCPICRRVSRRTITTEHYLSHDDHRKRLMFEVLPPNLLPSPLLLRSPEEMIDIPFFERLIANDDWDEIELDYIYMLEHYNGIDNQMMMDDIIYNPVEIDDEDDEGISFRHQEENTFFF